MSSHVIEVQQLSRRFGKSLALDQISINIQPGWVYGLVGANGAGKTTLMKHLLGLLRAKQGTVRVFGLDPIRNPVEVLSRVGFASVLLVWLIYAASAVWLVSTAIPPVPIPFWAYFWGVA